MTEHPYKEIDDTSAQQHLEQAELPSPLTQALSDRLATWEAAVEMEAQDLIKEAARLRQLSNEAKTATKRGYYDKKFKRVTADLMKMVATLERLQKHRAEANT